ncbi:TetR/AcrR family transcriptional regulator [Promicromonospora vindobonensis]|uniref:TetR/AcrR family transcriptional regulator n=1 Tax=Promicromonospora vindobonensis TaxID=195748 RepID=A0ABW5VX89_9MICO
MDNGRRRASPMTPDERRAAIAAAVMPLVAERGVDVTSRELAEAAGVAEGTLFRAFGDKTALVGAVAVEGLSRAGRPEETLAELTGIDPALPLERRLELVIELSRHRMTEVMRWMSVLRRMAPSQGTPSSPPVVPGVSPGPPGTVPGAGGAADQHERMHSYRRMFLDQRARQHEATVEGITAVLTPDLHRLRVPVEVAISLIESAITGAHARIDHLQPEVPADVLADALVNGLAGSGKKAGSAGPDPATSSSAAPGSPVSGSPAPSPEGNSL